MIKNKILPIIIFAKYLIDIVPKYINYIKIYKDEICIYTHPNNIFPLVYMLKNHNNCKFEQLVDISGVDYPNKSKRFEVVYNFLSISFNFRLRIKTKVNEITPVNSVSKIFKSSL